MANLVKFYTCTQAQYNALFSGDPITFTGNLNALYFTTDTKRLYKGSTLYGGSFEYCSTLPASGSTETLYFAANTGKISVWDGSKFVEKFLPFETTLTNTDDTVPTSKAIKTYVDAVSGYLDSTISGAIQTLDVEASGGNGKVITTISETDGKIAATAIDLITSAVSRAETTNVGGTTAEAALEDLGSKIATLNGSDSTNGSVAKAVKDAKDALSGAIGAGFDSTNTVAKAIADLEAGAVSISGAANNAIEVTSSGEGGVDKTVALKINANDKFLSQTSDGLSASFTLVKKDAANTADTNAAEYYIADKNGDQIGATINVPKDQFLQSASFVQGSGSGDDKLQLTFITSTGANSVVDIPLSGLFDEYEAGDGMSLTATATGIRIDGVIDATSENFLTVGSNGFKLAGVQDAITSAQTELSGAADFRLTTKLDDVTSGKADEIITATAAGKVQTSGKKVGGSSLAAEPDANTVATELAVSGYVSSAVSTLNSAKMKKFASAPTSGNIVTAKAQDEVEDSGFAIGSDDTAAGSFGSASTVATEAAVKTYVENALVWNTLP